MLKVLNYKHLFFFLIIVLQMVIYNYPYIAKIEPRTIHAHRQFDCLSFAQNFYNDRGTLVEPCLNNLGSKQNGKAASEFPIVPWVVGHIWKITGINTFVYRFINLIFIFFGLFYIYKLFLAEFKNKIFAALIGGLIFSSPALSYYGISTISDIQSFSLGAIGFYFFYSWIKTKANSQFYIFIVAFIFAGLLKASAAMIYVLCLLYLVFYYFETRKQFVKLFNKQNVIKAFVLVIPFVVWLIWYVHAKNYNSKNNGEFFLVGVLPIWELETERIYSNLRAFIYELIPGILTPVILYSVLIFIITNAFFNFKKQVSSSLILLSCLGMFVLFVLLFFETLDVHDYYLINMIGVLMISLFFILKIIYTTVDFTRIKWVFLVLSFIVAFNTYTSGLKTWKKINCNATTFENSVVFNAHEQFNYFWIYWLDRKMYKLLESDKINLEKIGVQKSDTIICLGDQTINRSLYLLNRVGYTSYNTNEKSITAFINSHKSIKYIVLIDPGMVNDTSIASLLNTKIFEMDSLGIYKVNQ
ncbi:MAG: glycosyltransferase family 39 protein [Bacteroidota bacterium]|nr:glycosyltransferase family 39 protein [Bacteroidota bacterium]